eukprot:CAMPEP_0201487826 /NCGR_PEP_ID=MMETSP0151_2-20130828/15535_1 /ASSEMBLY_ACC=CAM_ASM_000257 /TAXON_ID=200890 /ORGANISM="Paramoeba atlantica, Strain 621/1 / CCAP 1560/9" /LENGTH=125 /DNA_ID=CAMNT_0047872979 /DNA_START=54 /DNA_END=431 /DNA_ORIENTATION=+
MKMERMIIFSLLVVSLVSAEKFCSYTYSDSNCEKQLTKQCTPINENCQSVAGTSTKNQCKDDTYTLETWIGNPKCEGDPTVSDSQQLGQCVPLGEGSTKNTCGSGHLVISSTVLGLAVVFAFLKL